MPIPDMTAQRSLYRSRRRYRPDLSAAGGGGVLSLQSECCDAVACYTCPPGTACVWFGSSHRCYRLHAETETVPQFQMATEPGHYPWPYHCVSTDHHAEIYCHSGCFAADHEVDCVGPGPWG